MIQDITAPQAYTIIKALGEPSISVFSKGQLFDIRDVILEDTVKHQIARNVGPFLFWGGPPKHLKYYRGTLYTLLCDRLLDKIQAHGVQAAREVICIAPKKVHVWL